MVLEDDVDLVLKKVCKEIELRYDMYSLEIGTELDHIYFHIQSVPSYSVTHVVRTGKRFIA